jgi:hypothetical protein
MSATYETDFYAWANEQAALLRAGKLSEADVANIAEEIESMGRTEKRELINRLGVLLMHLLKWKYQPNLRGRSWLLTIKEQRRKVAQHLGDNPSLRSVRDEAFAEAYGDARLMAARETPMDDDEFPEACPWSFEQAIDGDFWPD